MLKMTLHEQLKHNNANKGEKISQILSYSHSYKHITSKGCWLTAWAALFSVSWMRVGMFFGFLGLGVRSALLLRPACESTRLPMSSPTLAELLQLLDGTFSLLVSSLTEGPLLSDEKKKGEEVRHLSSIWLPILFGLFLIRLTLDEMLLKTKCQGHPDAFLICSQAANVLFSVCAKSVYCPCSY